MEFYFKNVGGKTHLYREDGFIDEDLGELETTFTGKLKTNNIFGEDYELEDISGFFSKGKRYSIKSSNGINGVIEKSSGGKYVLK
ncbi:hypothetical protein [Clostridium intestinale]|uniref:Uncharacterized protein n=1 Tax=Clostridium intestinale DSM 6191 TaxID=1121320 RepID=A0A1M5TIV7_9CLOT|nr:hypothetical protein [Clostridium intestinale]WRY53097.1 hypothetical protein P8F83_07800 [Clostridium intestinale]SHH50591.1 hypothetical protein SAMN02745941_00227 [Clostridium intestinale DSM 6191]